jgi:hypothetical protein
LKSGTHKYKFSCQLPEQIPNTTELKYGNIEYFVEAVLEVPYKLDKEVRTPFFVDCDDLNFCQGLQEPVKHVELRNFSPYESLCATVMLPCSGFVAYQNVPITIFYENNSNAKILRTKITLVQSIEYKNKKWSKAKSEKNVLFENYVEGVNERIQKSVTSELRIPDVVISNTKYCEIISVIYTLEVDPLLSGTNENMKIEIPIIIGKIPMRIDPQRPPSIYQTYASAPTKDQLDDELRMSIFIYFILLILLTKAKFCLFSAPSYEELLRLKAV